MSQTKLHAISILGCGWVGLPLATRLADAGYRVKGTTTSPDKIQLLAAKNIEPFLLDIHQLADHHKPFFACDVLVIAVPPSLRKGVSPKEYLTALNQVVRMATGYAGKVIMVSSTGVYPDNNDEVDEETPPADDERAQVLYEAEDMWRRSFPGQHIILRSAGLMGGNRIPGRYFAGKKNLSTGHIPVNYVHRDDIVCILEKLADETCTLSGTYNAVAPGHPTRREVYLHNARLFGFDEPTFDTSASDPYKTVMGDKLVRDLAYVYKHPDPLAFSYDG